MSLLRKIGHANKDRMQFQFDTNLQSLQGIPPQFKKVLVSLSRGNKVFSTPELDVDGGCIEFGTQGALCVTTTLFREGRKDGFQEKVYDVKVKKMQKNGAKTIGRGILDYSKYANMDGKETPLTVVIQMDKSAAKAELTLAVRPWSIAGQVSDGDVTRSSNSSMMSVATSSGSEVAPGDVGDLGKSRKPSLSTVNENTPLNAAKSAPVFRGPENVIVTVIEADNLVAADIGGKSDPFVKLKIGSQKFKTKTIKKTLTPVWNEEFSFETVEGEELLKFTVYDRDIASSDFLGECEVNLSSLTSAPSDMWLPLTGVKKGRLHISAQRVGASGGGAAGVSPATPQRTFEIKYQGKSVDTLYDDNPTLYLTVISATDLKKGDLLSGSSDPYVKLKVGKSKAKTKVQSKTLNPVWNEDFKISIPHGVTTVEFKIYDYDVGLDDALGECVLDLDSVPVNECADFNLTLAKTSRGSLKVRAGRTGLGTPTSLQVTAQGGNLPSFTGDVVHVTIHEGRNLVAASSNNCSSDPLVSVRLGSGPELRTSTARSTLNPSWEERLSPIPIGGDSLIVKFKVWDEDSLNDFLGEYELHLRDIPTSEHEAKPVWVTLQRVKSGELRISCWRTGDGGLELFSSPFSPVLKRKEAQFTRAVVTKQEGIEMGVAVPQREISPHPRIPDDVEITILTEAELHEERDHDYCIVLDATSESYTESKNHILASLKAAGCMMEVYEASNLGGSETLITVGASTKRLQLEAERIGFTMRTGKDHAWEPFMKAKMADYVNAGVFDSGERTQILLSIMEAKHHHGGAGLDFDSMLNDKQVASISPLHDTAEITKLSKTWGSFRPLLTIFIWKWMMQPLEDIRNYFGEKIALYFAFLGFYTKWLIPPALAGIPVFLAQQFGKYTPEAVESMTLLFSIFMALWAVIMLEFWKRRENELKFMWNTENFEETEKVRREYRGEKTADMDLEPENQKKVMVGFIAIFFMILVLIGTYLAIMYSKVVFAIMGLKMEGTVATLLTKVPTVVTVITIGIFNKIYQKVASKLNDWEDHKTQTAFEDALILKFFPFQFFNNYFVLFFIAYLKGLPMYLGLPSGCGANPVELVNGQAVAATISPDDFESANACMSELGEQLAIIFTVKTAFSQIMEICMPFIKAKIKSMKEKRAQKKKGVQIADQSEDSELLEEMGKEVYGGVWDDYNEMAVQFGFVTLFAPAFPLAPALALLNNIIEIRGDAITLCRAMRRPSFEKAEDVGSWFDVYNTSSVVAVLTNTFLICFVGSNFCQWTADDASRCTDISYRYSLGVLWAIALCIEHTIFVVRFGLQWLIPDEPAWVSKAKKAQSITDKEAKAEEEHNEENSKRALLVKQQIEDNKKLL